MINSQVIDLINETFNFFHNKFLVDKLGRIIEVESNIKHDRVIEKSINYFITLNEYFH